MAVAGLTEVVRRERGRIIAGLVRVAGSLDAAEDALQDAIVSAMTAWPAGMPANPGAWLMTASRRAALDLRRHDRVHAAKAPLLAVTEDEAIGDPDAIADDYLRLLFTCCHPALGRDNQIALTLKVVAGFSTAEIARAFLVSEDTVSQRLLRAKRELAGQAIELTDPLARVDAVLGVIYAIVTEGHASRRDPLLADALRLAQLVCELAPDHAEAHALLAIVAFIAARAETRDVTLEHQDRSRWDRAAIREGLVALGHARSHGRRGSYELQAELAAAHVTARSYAATDWPAIVALYDELLAIARSPVVALNRAVAVAMVEGPDAGLALLAPLERDLSAYPLFHEVREKLRSARAPRGVVG